MSSSVDATLTERGSRYGDFKDNAGVTQSLKKSMQKGVNWDRLTDEQKEALEMVMHKVSRIVNGDPNHHDSWLDIIGYTRLVEKCLDPEITDGEQ